MNYVWFWVYDPEKYSTQIRNFSEISNYISDQAGSEIHFFHIQISFFISINWNTRPSIGFCRTLSKKWHMYRISNSVHSTNGMYKKETVDDDWICFLFVLRNPVASCVNFECISFVLVQSSIPHSLHMWLFRTFVSRMSFFTYSFKLSQQVCQNDFFQFKWNDNKKKFHAVRQH